MNHEILHYGNNSIIPNVEMSIPCSQSNHLSTSTHTLRQWRKKDVLLGTTTTTTTTGVNSHQTTPSPTQQPLSPAPPTIPFGQQQQQQQQQHSGGTAHSAPPDVHMADTGQTQGGQIARVAPHNHYPRGTAGTTQQQQQLQQQPPPPEQLSLQQQQQHQLYAATSVVGGPGTVAAAAAAHAAASAAAAARAHQHHQYGQMYGGGSGHPHPVAADYSYTPYKDPTSTLQHLPVPQHQSLQQPTPVKYSEIVEPPLNQSSHHSTSSLINKTHPQQATKEQLLASTKEYHQLDMCSGGGTSAMQQHHQMVATNQQAYNPTMMKHHQYLPQPPHHLSQYYKHAAPVHQYHQRYPAEPNNYLADLNKIAPQIAQSIINDPHLRDPNQMYAPSQNVYEAQRGSTYASASFQQQQQQQQQQQRLYGRLPGSTYHQKPPVSMYPPSSHFPRGYPVKTQSSTADPYRNMPLYQSPSVAKYSPQQEYSKQLHLMDFNRRSYTENMHQLNYALPSKVSPTSYSQCAQQQLDYAHHYQQSRHHGVPTVPSEYQHMSMKNVYLHHEQHPQLHMPDLVRDNTPKSSNSLKQYLENWNDEDLGGITEDSGIQSGSGSLDLADKPLIKIGRPGEGNENIYVLDSTDIPTETVSKFLQHVPQIDKLPDNIKFYPEIGKVNDKYGQYGVSSMEGILNLTSNSMKLGSTSEYSPPTCLRAEESLNIRPFLEESNKPQSFFSLPVIEDDEPVVRSNLRLEDPVFTRTSAIEEDSEVVPCLETPENRSEKCSPELGFVDCAISTGSVIVPNIGLAQKIEVAHKVEESYPKEDLSFTPDSVKSSVDLNVSNSSNDSNISDKVPKNNSSVVPSPVGLVDGETLDLSVVSDISASVDDKIVPDNQRVQSNTVINLASQNDRVFKSAEVESAMNLSRRDSTEDKGNAEEETGDSSKEIVQEMEELGDKEEFKTDERKEVKERIPEKEELDDNEELKTDERMEAKEIVAETKKLDDEEELKTDERNEVDVQIVFKDEHASIESDKEKDLVVEVTSEVEVKREENKDIDESSQEDDNEKSSSIVQSNHLQEEEIPSDNEEVCIERYTVNESDQSVTAEHRTVDTDNGADPIEAELKIDSAILKLEEMDVSKEEACELKGILDVNESVQVSEDSLRENGERHKENSEVVQPLDPKEYDDNKNERNLEDVRDLEDSPMSEEIKKTVATDVSNRPIMTLESSSDEEEDINIDKSPEIVQESLDDEVSRCESEKLVEKSENNKDMVEMDVAKMVDLDADEPMAEIPEKETDSTKNIGSAEENIIESKCSEVEECSTAMESRCIVSVPEIIPQCLEISNLTPEARKSIEASTEVHIIDNLKESEQQSAEIHQEDFEQGSEQEIAEPIKELEESDQVQNIEEKLEVEGNAENEEVDLEANNEEHQELDNEINEDLNILRILQNNVILQIADELIQINVINTNGRKIISVIALSDCAVITENNNNQEQANVEVEMQEMDEHVEDLIQEDAQDVESRASLDNGEPKIEENTTDENVTTVTELKEDLVKDDLPSSNVEDTVNINDETDLDDLESSEKVFTIEKDESKDNSMTTKVSIEGITSLAVAPLKSEDTILDNLETMLEADFVPDIDYTEEVNIQNEVIIGPDESQESISEEILLMNCEANKKQMEDLNKFEVDQEHKEVEEEENAMAVQRPNEMYLNDCVEDGLKEHVTEMIVDKGDIMKESEENENLAQEVENNDSTIVDRSKVELLQSVELKIEEKYQVVGDGVENTSTEMVPDLKSDLITVEPQNQPVGDVNYKKDLPVENVSSFLDETEVIKSCKELQVNETKIGIEDPTRLDKMLSIDDKKVDCKIEVLATTSINVSKNELDELQDPIGKLDTKKLATKLLVKLVEDNILEVPAITTNDLKKSFDKKGGLEDDDKEKQIDKDVNLKHLVEDLDMKEEIPNDAEITKVLVTESCDTMAVEKILKNQKEVSRKIDESQTPKTPDRPKIPGVDKLKTKFVIPKKNNSPSLSLNSSSTKQDRSTNSDTKNKKAKLVSFSTIVDEIKDRADAARDKKSSLVTPGKLTKILKKSTNAVVKKPMNKKRDARSLSESQPKKLLGERVCRRHSIASEFKKVSSSKKTTPPKKTASNDSLAESPKVENNTKKTPDKKTVVTSKHTTANEEAAPKTEKRSANQKPLETIIAKISRDAKKVALLKLDPSIAKSRDSSPVQKKICLKTLEESPKISGQTNSNLSGSSLQRTSTKSDIKVSGIEPLDTKTSSESPKSDPELIFKKENHSPKKYTKVKVFKSRLNSIDCNDIGSPSQLKPPEVKVKTKAELKEAIHLDIKDEPAVLHIESIISEKINQESTEKFLNASPPELLSPQTVNRPVNLDTLKPKNNEFVIEKDIDDEQIFPERQNNSFDKDDDTNRKRLSLKEYNNRKRKLSCCLDSPLSSDNISINSVDSPLQNLNPEPPEDDLPPPAKAPAIESAPSPPLSRMETSPKAEDMNLAAPTTPVTFSRAINTPRIIRSNSSSATDDATIDLQLVNSRTPDRSIEDEKEFIARKLEDLFVTIPIGQKSDNLINRFMNREQLSTEEVVRVKEIIEFKRAKEVFLKEAQTGSITSGLGIKPLESYRRLNFDIASDISIPVQMNDNKSVQEVPQLQNAKENVVSRNLYNYKKLNFDIASDISIPCSTSKNYEVFSREKLPQHVELPPTSCVLHKSQPIESEPVFKRFQAELLNATYKTNAAVNKSIGINKDKPSKPTTKINRLTIDNATTPKVLIKPSFLSSNAADGKDLLQDNGESVYEISSSTNEHSSSNRRNSSPTDELKIHLRKIQQASPTDSLTPTRKRKKKRFRNLYSADTESSDETTSSTSNSPAVRMAAANSSTTEENSSYSVICSGTFSGLPKIIIKRTNSDSGNCSINKVTSTVVTIESQSGDLSMQPVVRLVRNPRLDNLAKRKRKG